MTNTDNITAPTSRYPSHVAETANIINLVMIPVAIALVFLVLTNNDSPIRIWLSVAVFVLGSGSGLVQFFRLPSAALQLGVLIALSAATDILLGQGLLSLHNISGNAAVCLLAGITCVRPLTFKSNGTNK